MKLSGAKRERNGISYMRETKNVLTFCEQGESKFPFLTFARRENGSPPKCKISCRSMSGFHSLSSSIQKSKLLKNLYKSQLSSLRFKLISNKHCHETVITFVSNVYLTQSDLLKAITNKWKVAAKSL